MMLMPRINVLPKSVADLIAAGEVVERPASVVKELVENSIDAGAKSITVEIKNGGVTFIRVTDDGCGIVREDVPKAFISHATGKIKTAEDLDSIYTLGFRGEALPSVAAVSRLSLLTRTPDDETGTMITFEGGVQGELSDAGCPVGTTVIVKDLFFNVPARMKFLKRDVTEGTYISDALTRQALSHPGIRFTLIKDGKQVLSSPGNDSLYSAVYSLFDKATAEALIKCDYEIDGLKISGYISKPLNNRPNRNMQYFFVNGRTVRIPAAAPALDEAYKNSIMVGKFPMCFLFLTIDTSKVDVNVHPAKTEIRFSEENRIFEAFYYAAKSALNKGDEARPSVTLKTKDVTAPAVPSGVQLAINTAAAQTKADSSEKNEVSGEKTPGPAEKKEEKPFKPFAPVQSAPPARQNTLVFMDGSYSQPSVSAFSTDGGAALSGFEKKAKLDIVFDEPEKEKPVKKEEPARSEKEQNAPVIITAEQEKPAVRIIGEAFRTYIIAEQGSKLYIIDKHAAHERMIFNSLSKNSTAGAQQLLSPVRVSLAPKEYAAVLDNADVFSSAGYSVEDFGQGTVLVRECPCELTGADITSVITEMAGKLLSGNRMPVPEKLSWLYHSTACRAAVKAGDRTDPAELKSFVEKILSDGDIKYCPHGRPVLYELGRSEIEKQFGRLG